ncbi:MAG: hypothetical protein USCGTAYLOR_02718 [Chromatiales bacterium USCg_Taylor]|nr:MAG: hypothetical protein USCGTAYLOR_02718 [Chromatiales bacterium USCg_Taylor]
MVVGMRIPRMGPARSAALSFKVRGGAAFWRVRCRELLGRLIGRHLLFSQLQQ